MAPNTPQSEASGTSDAASDTSDGDYSADGDGIERKELAPNSAQVTHIAVFEPDSDVFKLCAPDVNPTRFTVDGTTVLTDAEAVEFALFVLEKYGIASPEPGASLDWRED